MDLFLGIGDMPIYNFDKVLKTNNMSYLVVGWNEREEIKPPKEALKRWEDIYNEYCKRTANNDALNLYSLSCEVGYLEMRYTSIVSLYMNLCEAYKEEIGLRLNKWKIPFNIKGSIYEQKPNLERHLRIAKQNLDMKKRKLNTIKEENEENESPVLLKQKIRLERVVGIKINIKETSVEEWIELHNEAKEIIKQQKASKNG
jgi:hypothetical protein